MEQGLIIAGLEFVGTDKETVGIGTKYIFYLIGRPGPYPAALRRLDVTT
jgi:hypothetical protein